MAILDLQGMEQKPSAGAIKGKSGASKGCTIGGGGGGGGSRLSLLLC
ncbi:MAG TPA: SapB/AmfS family lanthipeptide [Acidimicrobiales bacterium]|jgi:hypothetical protein|nr:SapB/AmfS family lanthipeptide [Acidimicrobiales bacterium]